MPPSQSPARRCDRCGAQLASYNRGARCAPCSAGALRRPPEVPSEFWDLPEMRDALATLHMGRVVYVYRNHPWHGQVLKQSVVAGWFGLTQTQLSRIENGRAPEEISKLVRWAKLLGIPAELRWFKVPGEDAPAETSGPVLTVPVIVGGKVVPLPVDVRAARATGLGDLLDQFQDQGADEPIDGLLPDARVPFARGARVHALAPGDAGELERLAAAVSDPRRYLDGSVVELLHGQLDRCKSDDGKHGPARALPLTLGVLGVVTRHGRETRADVRSRLLSLGAEAAEFAGWLYRDLKDQGNAVYWYDRAMEWAQETRDPAMQGYVLLKKAQMAYDDRDAHRVAALASAASQGPWQLPARVRAEAVQQEARGLAMLGEPFNAVERKLGEAEAIFTAADRAGGPPAMGGYFTEGALLTRRACCYMEAGKPALAASVFGEAIEGNGLSWRDEGFFRALRSQAYALSGAPDIAAEEGLTALSIATATNSGRTARELARAVNVLAPWRSRPGSRQLREALGARALPPAA